MNQEEAIAAIPRLVADAGQRVTAIYRRDKIIGPTDTANMGGAQIIMWPQLLFDAHGYFAVVADAPIEPGSTPLYAAVYIDGIFAYDVQPSEAFWSDVAHQCLTKGHRSKYDDRHNHGAR